MNQPLTNSPKQILLVENSNTARLMIGRDLSAQGYQISYAATGKEAVNLLSQQPIDLVVMDLFLPELNGYEAAEAIRQLSNESANIPIFAYTASENEFDKKRCIEAGMNEYIIKSANNKCLLEQVTKYLGA